jgi:thiol-disulfide isomerase/thioredoxin
MNKRLIFYLLVISVFSSCKNNTVEISGTLTGNPVKGRYIFLDELKANDLLTVDSVLISENGTFNFKKEVKSPSFYLLKINDNNFLTTLLEPGEKLTITAHRDSLNFPSSITGSPGTKLMADYNINLRRTITKLSGLNSIYEKNANSTDLPAIMETLDSMATSYLSEINFYTKNYIDNNLPSLVCLVALYQQVAPNVYVLNPSKDMKYYLKVDSVLFSRYPSYEPVIALHDQVKELAGGPMGNGVIPEVEAPGAEAPEISLPSPMGDTIKLSSTRGSVVLLDFWASWCAPCRQENPNLVKAYNIYHNKGFQIFQVSLDKTKDAWLEGIKNDQLDKWIHVSDIQYWNSVVVPLYKIESIPFNFLLDKDGRIIASNLRGERLLAKLEEIFKK